MKTRVAGLAAGFLLVALVSAVVLVASASHSAASGVPVKVGLVTDDGTLADKGYNWLSYQGLLRAENELDVEGAVYTSTSSADYGPNLQQCVDDGNSLCISVGFFTGQAISGTAAANPGTSFAIVDFLFEDYPSNLRGMGFAPEGVGYLAGTLAGLMTESGVIGGVGGMRLSSVEGHLEPYRNGAQCATAGVTVLITYTGTFVDPDLGAVVAQDMMSAGADVIFTVGGPTGNGALLETTQSDNWGIGVDADQYVTLFNGGTVPGSDKVLSSAMKNLDNAVFDTISDVVDGAFTSGTVVYDLTTDGVGLAPFHEADPYVPQSVRDALSSVKQGIIDGSIDVSKGCYFAHLPLVNRSPSP
jgi:basic membrane lipoprotein Med (substrate-binding protein (PBP1-ABC) superfamily)